MNGFSIGEKYLYSRLQVQLADTDCEWRTERTPGRAAWVLEKLMRHAAAGGITAARYLED